MATSADAFGRVDDDGTVSVREGDVWRAVGSFPDGTPEEALAYFTRKFDDLEAIVSLAEQRIKAGAAARDITKQLNRLDTDLLEPSAVGDIAALRGRVHALREKLPTLEAKQDEASQAAVAEALAHREKIVADMEAIAGQDPSKIRWKQATITMTELFEAWQTHQQSGPRVPKKTADELWGRFRSARNTLEKARRAYFQDLDKVSKEAKTIKKDLITAAEALLEKGSAAIPAYRSLLDRWKEAPRASKSVEDGLWAQFKKAGDALYGAKAAEDKRDDETNSVNAESKRALLAEFADILTLTERDQASQRLRSFQTRFAALGPVPKKLVRAIDDQVKKLETHVRSLEQEFWTKNDPEKKARSESMTGQLTAAIAELESKLRDASDSNTSDLEAELAAKKAWLEVLN
ncbi:MAG: DUF349 domain-containing protein [Actinobacteria bacterium]|uniref:Unannotated protein n=1 Tax=freshwater metagenome TaxID=449393 RepID=A0A6J6JPF2_9ZZZZ|nr:DUF349 domain-containing protein [Actinomycetota bacterium]